MKEIESMIRVYEECAKDNERIYELSKNTDCIDENAKQWANAFRMFIKDLKQLIASSDRVCEGGVFCDMIDGSCSYGVPTKIKCSADFKCTSQKTSSGSKAIES